MGVCSFNIENAYGEMTTPKKKIILVGGVAVIILVCITAWVLWKLSPEEQKKSRMLNTAKKMNEMWNIALDIQKRSKFTISGKIVDDAGQPVDQVEVRISQGYLKNGGFSTSYTESQQIVNSDFKLDISGGSGVSLTFHKNNYYDVENLQYSLPQSKTTWGFSDNVVAADNQRIVLERKGVMAKYKRKAPGLFMREEQNFTCYSIPLLGTDYNKEYSFDKINSLPPGTIYPRVERDKDGKLVKVVVDNVGKKRFGPRMVSVNMIGGDKDGFIIIKESPDDILSIKEAPESGYVKQMLFHLPEDMHKHYFYYKFGNCYGKGIVRCFNCNANGEIMIGLELYQNIEDSSDLKVRRNLRTERF